VRQLVRRELLDGLRDVFGRDHVGDIAHAGEVKIRFPVTPRDRPKRGRVSPNP
jgi:hypothetical protein